MVSDTDGGIVSPSLAVLTDHEEEGLRIAKSVAGWLDVEVSDATV